MSSKLVQSRLPCPSCPSSDAYHLYDDGHGYCFSCKTYVKGDTLSEEVTGDYFVYLAHRGITEGTFRHFDVKTKCDGSGAPISLGFRYPSGATKVRPLDKKEFYWVGQHKSELFGLDKFAAGAHKYVTITEGELDALSLFQVLKTPVVSVQSAASAARDATVARSWLNSYERIYLAFDNDEAGRRAVAEVARLFDYTKVFHVQFTNRKDANEYLQAGEGDQLRQIWWNSKQYLPQKIKNSFADFKKILEEAPAKGVPYPWPTLNDMTYGIRTSESVLLCAPTGVGKTELMHAIEYQLLKETDANVGAIFIEEPQRRHLQALASIHLHSPVHLPDSSRPTDQVVAAVQEAVGTDERLHLYSHFGSDDPEVLLDTIRFLVTARNCRYILLDHITMVVCGLAGNEERTALDYLASRLEMMVVELDFALIMVSHVNDLGQTRGSRGIGQIANIRIDATRDLLNPDPYEKNVTTLVVPKNRFGMKTGFACKLFFDQSTNLYTELAANDNYGGKDARAA